MSPPRFVVRILTVGLMALPAIGTVSGQSYPSKPIRVVTAGIGSSSLMDLGNSRMMEPAKHSSFELEASDG